MPRPERTPEERERDLVILARMYCRGVSQVKMAATLELHRSTIQYDLETLRERWGKLEQDNVRASELARIDHLESTYWEAWEQSLKAKTQRKKAKSRGGMYDKETSEVRTERRDGNQEFLAGVKWCIEMRCRILGYLTLRVQHSGDQENPINVSVTVLSAEHREASQRSILTRLGHRGLAPSANGHDELPGPAQG